MGLKVRQTLIARKRHFYGSIKWVKVCEPGLFIDLWYECVCVRVQVCVCVR